MDCHEGLHLSIVILHMLIMLLLGKEIESSQDNNSDKLASIT